MIDITNLAIFIFNFLNYLTLLFPNTTYKKYGHDNDTIFSLFFYSTHRVTRPTRPFPCL